jgi:hypothetical protein
MCHALLRRLLFIVALLAASGGAHATRSIVAQEEFGFSYLAGESWLLRLNGASQRYDHFFDLAFRDGAFVLTARKDNNIARSGSLPYGLDIYWADQPRVTPDEDHSTSLVFIPWQAFPDQRGESLRIALRSSVPEPQQATMLAAGILALLLAAQARKPRLRRLA